MHIKIAPIVALFVMAALVAGTPAIGFAKEINTKKANYSVHYIDAVAPVISKIRVETERTKVKIRWTTSEKSDTRVYISTSTPVSKTASTTLVITKNSLKKSHKATFKKLAPNTVYYALIESRDASGNITTSPQISFTTNPKKGESSPVPQPFTIRNIDALVGTSTIRVTWDTNKPSTSRVYYSTTPAATSSASIENTALTQGHDITLSGLGTSTRYYLMLESKDSNGNTKQSSQINLITRSGM